MTCPGCKIKLECPCRNCRYHRKKEGKIAALAWEWVDGNTMRCPICGFTHLADFWEDYEFYKYDKERGELLPGQEEYIMKEIEAAREAG
jgi:hypothetical protein